MKEQLDDYIINNLDKIYRFAYNRLRSEYDAEDLTQEIILTAMRNAGNIIDITKLDAWFWGVARNVCMRSFKPKREMPTEESMLIDISGIHYTTPESEYLKNYDMSNVRRAVSYLAKIYRDVAVLHYIEEKDYNTIADELSIPLSSVKWRLNQSKNQLKEELVKMDTKYMAKGYRKAVDYKIRSGGMMRGKGDYNKKIAVLNNLLAKNICLTASNTSKTVTEISNDLGVSADYVEYHIDELLDIGALIQISNKYQANFPIIADKKRYNDLYIAMFETAKKDVSKIVDIIYECKNDIVKIEFECNDKEFDKLVIVLAMIIADQTKGNKFFDMDLPFKGEDCAWFILGIPNDNDDALKLDGGVNSIESDNMKAYIVPLYNSEMFTYSTDSTNTLIKYYKTKELDMNNDTVKYELSHLIENKEIIKENDFYKINVPVIHKDKYSELIDVLQPAINISNEIKVQINKTANEWVKENIINRSNWEEFFTHYFTLNMINIALIDEIRKRKINLTNDMLSWYVLKN